MTTTILTDDVKISLNDEEKKLRLRQQKNAWRLRNKEKHAASMRKCYEANKEKRCQYAAARYKKMREGYLKSLEKEEPLKESTNTPSDDS